MVLERVFNISFIGSTRVYVIISVTNESINESITRKKVVVGWKMTK